MCFTLIFVKKGYHIRKYKRYLDDPSVPVPKSSKFNHNRCSVTRSNTAISMPQSVISTELAVVPTELSTSHNGETFSEETGTTMCNYRGALEFLSTNGYVQSKVFLSFERGFDIKDTRLSFYTTSKILYWTYKG